ncbi:MAG: protein kinase domain-containing protein, partial [Bryobacteraceae bacterium]
RVGRDVAIKVSSGEFSERFSREARAIAALNHPNVCTLYDVGPNYLVMELVEGESPKGPLPLNDTLNIARQIAAALDAAHEKGIVHRDLKPANIKIKTDGIVKVLDFGLAQLAQAPATDAEDAPTLSLPLTEAGMVMGTASYMAPEQAQGQPLDRRADVWAFGVVIWELLTGQRLFKGGTLQDTLVQVMTKEIDFARVPVRAQPLLQRCLERDCRRRLRDIGDAMALLDHVPAIAHPARRPWLAWTIAAFSLSTTLLLAFLHFREARPPAAALNVQILPPQGSVISGVVSISPDGHNLVYRARGDDDAAHLWLRPLDRNENRPIAVAQGLQDGASGFWSPDSAAFAFVSGGKLRRIGTSGEAEQTVCDLTGPVNGGFWNRDGRIILSLNGQLFSVPQAGGSLSPVAAADGAPKEGFRSFPSPLPDGRHFLYTLS